MREKAGGSGEVPRIEETGGLSTFVRENSVLGGARGSIPKVGGTHEFGEIDFDKINEKVLEKMSDKFLHGKKGDSEEVEEVEEVAVESEEDRKKVLDTLGKQHDLNMQAMARAPETIEKELEEQKKEILKFARSVAWQNAFQGLGESAKGFAEADQLIAEAVVPADLPDMSAGAL